MWCTTEVSTFLKWVNGTRRTPRSLVPLPMYVARNNVDRQKNPDELLSSSLGLQWERQPDFAHLDNKSIFCFVVLRGVMYFDKPGSTSSNDALREGQALFCGLKNMRAFRCSTDAWVLPILWTHNLQCGIGDNGPRQIYANCDLVKVKSCGTLDLLHDNSGGADKKHTYIRHFKEGLRALRKDNYTLQDTVQMLLGSKYLPLAKDSATWDSLHLDVESCIESHRALVMQLCRGEVPFPRNLKTAVFNGVPDSIRVGRKAMVKLSPNERYPRRVGRKTMVKLCSNDAATQEEGDEEDDDDDDDVPHSGTCESDDSTRATTPLMDELMSPPPHPGKMEDELACHPEIVLGEKDPAEQTKGKIILYQSTVMRRL